MIDFELTEDHKAIRQTVRDFATQEVAPRIKELDEKQQFDRSFLDKMAELNILGVCIPEEYGGAGLEYISLGLVCEELEAVDTSLRVVMSVHTGLNSMTLLTWGTAAQKRKYLVPQAKGEKLATYGLTEPGAGSDVVGSRSTARREGDEWVLNGEKMWISLADVADNFLFFCWTDEEKRRKRDHTGMSCFIVERSMPGFSSGTIHGKLGIRAGNTGYFSLQDVRVSQENMLGEEGEGFKIAEMEADYQMSRLLWLRAGWLKNEGRPNGRATSLAKWQATVRSEKAASMAIEVHGANGYSNDYPVERYLRNCKAAVIYEGTRDIHTLMQADWALGLKSEKPARKTLPPYRPSESREAVGAD